MQHPFSVYQLKHQQLFKRNIIFILIPFVVYFTNKIGLFKKIPQHSIKTAIRLDFHICSTW